MDTETVVIDRRYRGPPESANGGYVAGLLAGDGTRGVRVTLRAPPPLDEPLTARRTADGRADLLAGAHVLAEAEPVAFAPTVPGPVAFADAQEAVRRYRWRKDHPYPGCFVCGPERAEVDGLRLFPGRVRDREVVAAPWVPHEDHCGPDGRVRPEIAWAALDCPTCFGFMEAEGDERNVLLGRLTAVIRERPKAGERTVVTGWSRGREGRKLHGGAALHGEDGRLLGASEATWIVPKE